PDRRRRRGRRDERGDRLRAGGGGESGGGGGVRLPGGVDHHSADRHDRHRHARARPPALAPGARSRTRMSWQSLLAVAVGGAVGVLAGLIAAWVGFVVARALLARP